MRAPKGRKAGPSRELVGRLHHRVVQLEERLALVEAKVRRLGAQTEALARVAEPRMPKIRAPRERPRCPGCRLELPKGRRGDSCVWCGFVFDALYSAKH
jgi:hypothetical protein